MEHPLSRAEVAEIFQVSLSTVTRWARQARIPAVRTPGGHYRYPAAPIRQLAETIRTDSERREK